MCRILWLKACSAEPACKKCVLCMPLDSERLFGVSLDMFIKENVILTHKQKPKAWLYTYQKYMYAIVCSTEAGLMTCFF